MIVAKWAGAPGRLQTSPPRSCIDYKYNHMVNAPQFG